MKKYCISCDKYVQGTKKRWSWGWAIITGIIPYLIYHAFFKFNNKCPICGLKGKWTKPQRPPYMPPSAS